MTAGAVREPHRVLAAGAVLGLLCGPRTDPGSWLAVALLAIIVGRHIIGTSQTLAVAAASLMLATAVLGGARADALSASSLTPAVQPQVAATVTLLEAFRRDSEGEGARALVRLRGEPVLLRTRSAPPPAVIGTELSVRGRLTQPDRGARARRAHATLAATAIRDTGERRGGVLGIVDAARTRATAALRIAVPQREGALLTGMVLGQDAELPLALQEDMRTTSLSHLTAASGQNVALLAAMASGIGIVLGFGVRGRWLLALAFTAFYVPLAGGGPSITRAAIMGAATIVAALAGRPSSRADAVLLAALLTLAIDPRSAADLGWQLSFAAVIGIALLASPTQRRLQRFRVPRVVAQVFAVTLAATLATAPILALRLGQLSPLAIPANVLAAPAVPLVMGFGAAAAAVGQVSVDAARPLTVAAAIPAAYVAAVGERLADVTLPSRLGGSRAPPIAPGTLRVTALDIGQGDATLLEAGGARVLIDTGPPGTKLRRALRVAAVSSLDAVVLTHSSLDHIGDAPRLLRETPAGLVLDGRGGERSALLRSIDLSLAASGARRVAVAAGQRISVGPIVLSVLWPPRGRAEPGVDPNDWATVLIAEAYGRRVLMTADAESNVLAPLRLPVVDVLKVSHHGSADPGLPGILQRVRPRIAVIEVGKHNSYGHPTASTLAALARARVPIKRTDRDGTVRIDLGSRGLRVSP